MNLKEIQESEAFLELVSGYKWDFIFWTSKYSPALRSDIAACSPMISTFTILSGFFRSTFGLPMFSVRLMIKSVVEYLSYFLFVRSSFHFSLSSILSSRFLISADISPMSEEDHLSTGIHLNV